MASALRVVLDSNIFISALIVVGSARRLVYKLVGSNAEIILSDYIVNEVTEVLSRKKFEDYDILEEVWELAQRDATFVNLDFKLDDTIVRDPKDHPILQTAQEGNADYLVSGDDDLLSLGSWEGIEVVTLREMEELL